MADEEDSSDSIHVVFPIYDPMEPTSLETLDPISQWCDPMTYDAVEDHNCNPFASTSFDPCSSTVERWSSGADWPSDTDSERDRDISCFVTDLFERGSHSSELKREGLEVEGFELGGEEIGGLRIVDFDSESDCEDSGVRVIPCLEEESPDYVEGEFDWEEVGEGVSERENLSTVIGNDDEDDEVVEVGPFTATEIETIETEIYETALVAVQNFEWEIMMAINRLASNASLERNNSDDGYIYAIGHGVDGVEYDALFEQFIESESPINGGHPTAKGFVESLPSVEPKEIEEKSRKDDLVCAICKDRVSANEKAKRLPCCHYYHSDCIVPWLGIRNTCPVCRFEMPTDDLDYERRKSQTRLLGSQPRSSQVVLNLEFP